MKLALQDQSNNFTPERLDELINHCKQNKRESQKILFDTFAGKMMTLCRRYAIDEQNAQDILQEGFINVFSNLSKFGNKGSFEGWMKRIFINTAIRYQKKFKTRFIQVEPNEKEPKLLDEFNALDHLLTEEILSTLDQLPLGYRTIFNLSVIEGYNHKEIGLILNIEESTSRSQLFKAKNALKEILGNQYAYFLVLLLFLILI